MPGHVGVEPSESVLNDMSLSFLFSKPRALVSRHGKRCGSCNHTDGTIQQCREVYNLCVAGGVRIC